MGEEAIEYIDGQSPADIGGAVWHKKLRITYVDGEVINCTTREWPEVRAEGVDYIDFKGSIQRSGDSVYYLYTEQITEEGEMAWVVGSFSVHDNECEEHIMRANNETLHRKRKNLPDICRDQLKLGWWRREEI